MIETFEFAVVVVVEQMLAGFVAQLELELVAFVVAVAGLVVAVVVLDVLVVVAVALAVVAADWFD